MTKKTALVTNALDFVGPPAVAALVQDGFQVVAQDSEFADEDKQARFAASYPDAKLLTTAEPDKIIAA